MQVLVSSLQQHFLLFSQRLHSAEMERRTLRLEVASLRRGGQRWHEREEMVKLNQDNTHNDEHSSNLHCGCVCVLLYGVEIQHCDNLNMFLTVEKILLK